MSQPSLHKSPDDKAPPPSTTSDAPGPSPEESAAPSDQPEEAISDEAGSEGASEEPSPAADAATEPASEATAQVSADQALIANLRHLLASREKLLAEKDDQLKGYITAYKQATADMDRERDRLARDRERALDQDRMAIAGDLLDVLDNLERSRDSVAGGGELGDLVQGLDMVYQQFLGALSRLGVERINALGQTFDAGLHEATGMVPATGDQCDQEIIHEERPGYLLGGRLLRPSRVIVASSGE